MKCSNPDCKKEIEPGSRFCPQCGTPIPQESPDKGVISGVRTGDIGYVEGNITDASQHGRSYVGSVVVQTGEHKAPSIVTCPICGRRNELMNTFECMQCHMDCLCLRHQDEETNLCQVCTREHKARLRIEKLERDAREAEAADDLEGAIVLLDQLLPLTENRQDILDWKSRLQQKLEDRHNEEPEEPFSIMENTIGMKFVLLPEGTFTMGSPPGEKGREERERQHRVKLTKGFYMQTTPVTVGQWRKFILDSGYKTEAETGDGAIVWTGSEAEKKKGAFWDNPGFSQNDNHPVTCVSWNDVQKVIKWLNRKEGTDKYRLPAEAEWEYASRSESDAAFCSGDDEGLLCDYGWYYENSDDQTHPVSQKKANDWGLYDMHGNVWEWCRDWYGDYPSGSVTDPKGQSTGLDRVIRGGGWYFLALACRSAYRYAGGPGAGSNVVGFRLARDP